MLIGRRLSGNLESNLKSTGSCWVTTKLRVLAWRRCFEEMGLEGVLDTNADRLASRLFGDYFWLCSKELKSLLYYITRVRIVQLESR